ncbi:MAG TPA: RNA methyltransferase [Pyrinomonadaceae bacterium]
MEEKITSRHNPLVRRAREVREGKDRGLVFVEGLRLCEEAAHAGLEVAAVLHTDTFARDERAQRLLDSLSTAAAKVVAVSDAVMGQLSDTKSPQGVVLLARRPASGPDTLDARPGVTPLVVVLHRVQNPSNAGAILRVAEAAGATAVVTTTRTADLFSPKALRGAMGSTFRLPVWAGAEFGEVLEWCARRGVRTVSTSLGAARTHTELDWRGPRAVVVGSEGAGLGHEEALATDDSIRIPMRAPVESLNVAVAVAVVLYEAARQRSAL